MSLFQRYSDPNDPVHPDYEKKKKKEEEEIRCSSSSGSSSGSTNDAFQIA